MKPERDNGSQWDRVAAELRECREAQQRAWGDIDNTTLGRFLAGEVTPEEQQQIENALDELPELRKLTELVRDVLGESDSAAPEPVSVPRTVPYGPAILPFTQPQPQFRSPAPAPGFARVGRPWLRDSHFRQRAGLVAAAGLLLVLGFTLPRVDGTSAQAERTLALSQPVATHITAFAPNERFPAALDDGKEMAPRMMMVAAPAAGAAGEEENLLDRISASVQALETEGKKHEAETLARQYASNLTRKALVYQSKGDLVRAEPALNQACALCDRMLGSEAPETVRMRNSLADYYEVALNAAPPSPYSAPPADSNPYLAQRSTPLPPAYTNEYFRTKDSPPSPAPPASRVPSPRSAPASAPSKREHHLATAMKSAASLGYAHQGPASVTYHHSHHSAHISHTAAVALRDCLTRKSQRELKASVVPVLTKALREATNSGERQRLARALGQLGPAARQAVPVLIECYRQAAEPSEQAALLSVFSDIGPSAYQALPVVLEVVQNVGDHPPGVYISARQTLAQLAPAARCRHNTDGARDSRADALAREALQYVKSPEGRSGIVDEAECFSVNALRQNQKQIRHLAATYKVEVLIQTVPGKIVANDHKALAGNGVYLCIHKDVPRVQVYLSEALRKQGLADTDLRQAVDPHLQRNDFDRGLQAGVAFLADFEARQAGK
jgi:hypothetical protein